MSTIKHATDTEAPCEPSDNADGGPIAAATAQQVAQGDSGRDAALAGISSTTGRAAESPSPEELLARHLLGRC